ncbi:low molecular weight protein-tyrosine-phosphatase [Antarctobacter heliothermus]|uniref:protein-tyrosine-phosphatase n=1 Tax=Antarctobacter heliothermus TaxID=74033 RepID=A0A239J3C9_9RHOB|nr:low molecular weight protein-tyrosine-phosphatase [Antarctobacter heliothermus]SNT00421.1 protein-tyrosine phosphatase [Antarctobacter heliothermus]
MSHRILFVCLGNICRSPTAEAVVRAKADAQGVPVELDSAGTGNWHSGAPPYGPMQDVARARGYDMSDLRARQVSSDDFGRFELIVAMDAQNLDDLNALAPRAGGARIRLMTDFAASGDATQVPDPYFTRDFDGALDLIERCADGLLRQL